MRRTEDQGSFLSGFLRACAIRPEDPFLFCYVEPYRMRTFTFSTLEREADRLTGFINQSVGSGGMVFLLVEAVELLVPAWLACLLAGAVPGILTPPTEKIDRQRYLTDLVHILDRYPMATVVCDEPVLMQLSGIVGSERLVPLREALDAAPPFRASHDLMGGDRPLLFQQSSGTTQIRKGLVLSQTTVLAQLRAYSDAIDLTPDDRIISWLPLYHDMGLIACLVQAVYHALPLVLCSPFMWLREPSWLLTATRRHRATLCWLPNFAFALLRHKGTTVRLAADSLTSLRLLISCSEPVLAPTLTAFEQTFVPFGLRADCLSASYAMAETVFAVTQQPPGSPLRVERLDREGLEREGLARPGEDIVCVSSGLPLPGCQVDIRPSGETASAQDGDGWIGQIHVKAPFLFSGYVGIGEEIPALDADGWFATGDIGYRRNGHLFVIGRHSDRMIRAGRNLDPLAFETATGSLVGVKAGRVVCFGVPDEEAGTEEVVLMAEMDSACSLPMQALQSAIRKATEAACGMAPQRVVLVPPGTLLKSSSGKISRSRCRALYMSGPAEAATQMVTPHDHR